MPRAVSNGEQVMIKRLGAEFIGTFWLVLGGCGSAVLAANFGGDGNPLGIGLLGVSLAFGLTVLTDSGEGTDWTEASWDDRLGGILAGESVHSSDMVP